jgi:hypothetical protein
MTHPFSDADGGSPGQLPARTPGAFVRYKLGGVAVDWQPAMLAFLRGGVGYGGPRDGAQRGQPDRGADLLAGLEQPRGDTGVLFGHVV